jgi:pimeloyl-ACP methyl ester carboxylesterase
MRMFALAAAGLALAAASLARATPEMGQRQALDGCLSSGPDVALVKLKTSRGRIRAAILGNGRAGVVLSNQSEQNLCSWLPYARQLVQRGFRVLLYDYGYGTYRSEVRAAVAALVHRGARRVALMGSSQGGKVVLHAASWRRIRVAAVVDISGERYLGGTDIRKDVARIRVPSLFVASDDDPFGAGKAARVFFATSPAKVKRLIVVPGTAHGFELLAGLEGATRLQSIIDFLVADAGIAPSLV